MSRMIAVMGGSGPEGKGIALRWGLPGPACRSLPE